MNNHRARRLILTLAGIFVLVSGLAWPAFFLGGPIASWRSAARAQGSLDPAAVILVDGNDYATRVLGNPWDLSEYSDISQGLNQSGQSNFYSNIQVQNGLFSARTNQPSTLLYLLWPGFRGAMKLGRIGYNFPIATSTYNCLYVALQASGGTDANLQAYWYQDDHLNVNDFGQVDPSRFGFSANHYLYHDAPVGTWRLMKIWLGDPDPSHYQGNTRWSAKSAWQGLSINPVWTANVNFSIDWARLTDCNPVNRALSWTGGVGTIWLSPLGTGRNVLIAQNQASPYALDLQGVQPGIYTYKVTATNDPNSSLRTSGTLQINQTPIAFFERPSFYSGPDFATQNGQPWDFTDSNSVSAIHHISSYSFVNGLLDFITQSGPHGVPSGDPDAQIFLVAPAPIDNSTYRYLSFRLNTIASLQNVPDGMIVRWIWTRLVGGQECYLVGQDVGFDVGWQIYSVDLFDPVMGSVVQVQPPGCTSLPAYWNSTGPATKLRFDPNENVLGYPLHQQLDWVRLTQPDQVRQGDFLPVKILLNKPASQIGSKVFYYTDSRSNPTQHLAQIVPPPPISPPDKPFKLYMPISITSGDSFLDQIPADFTFLWDTKNVTPGSYYICVFLNDGYNSNTNCSDAFVIVK